jgi:hypothetical protein
MQSAMDYHGLGAKYPGQRRRARRGGAGCRLSGARKWQLHQPVSMVGGADQWAGAARQARSSQGFAKQQSNPANLIGSTDYLAQIQQYLNPQSIAAGGAASGTQTANPYEQRLQQLVNDPNSISDSNAYKFRFNQGSRRLSAALRPRACLAAATRLRRLRSTDRAWRRMSTGTRSAAWGRYPGSVTRTTWASRGWQTASTACAPGPTRTEERWRCRRFRLPMTSACGQINSHPAQQRQPGSCARISGKGLRMYGQEPMDRIGRLMSLRDLVAAGQMAPDAKPLPVNTMRNNTTGAEYQFASLRSGAQGPQLDYSQPIEIFGQGKGYAIKGQPLSAMINGRRVDYGVDGDASRKATQAAQDRTMKLAEQMQGLDAGALDIAKKRMENSAMQSTGGAKPLTESQGKGGGFRNTRKRC